ncbi:sugar-binding protein [Pseudokineococcus lusitanus]|uniref:Alpha-galactosidase-like protein n=1 Tax=Pseudokineococcus lusitanus TaxID=763993 RepID=A0A3N1HJT8_9ACTN|nr:sugar-binding protein [Pseudokineococcus lusitanus]ROP42793.1 alpha-galactosidase-like protein [Pseudokineococcus lusitanus]
MPGRRPTPRTPRRGRSVAGAAAAVLAAGLLAATPAAAGGYPPSGRGAPPDATTSAGAPVDLDVMFVGAHPDDEASLLSTLGQWREDLGVRSGVITVTRGEGGGNAVGTEEGPELGLLREVEERRAVGLGGVENIYNLDEVDFYYTVSAPLTQEVWSGDEAEGAESVLEKVVRVVRTTRPEVLVTMDPAPSPGNHGHHQEAARLAMEAYRLAGDPSVFPDQITEEGLEPFSPGRVLQRGLRGTPATGPSCSTGATQTDPSQTVYGVWAGRTAPDGRTWGAVERDAQRQYVSQGWGVFPDVPADPDALGCDYLTEVAARVPSAVPGSDAAARPDAALQGALVRGEDAAPLGTGLEVRAEGDAWRVVPGGTTEVSVAVRAGEEPLPAASVTLDQPAGWTAAPATTEVGDVAPGEEVVVAATLTAPADAVAGTRVRLGAGLTSGAGGGYAAQVLAVVAPVRGEVAPLPQVAEAEAWAAEVGLPWLQGSVRRVATLPVGGSEVVDVVVTNADDEPQQGSVALDVPEGFTAEDAVGFGPLAPGEQAVVPVTVTSTDPAAPTSADGQYPLVVTTTTADGRTGTTTAALELVPATTVPRTDVPAVVDGVAEEGEHPGEVLDVSRVWEGTACASAADCSATAQVSWHAPGDGSSGDDVLQLLVRVEDDVRGTVLPAADCKRHWRTDSVEIAVDPRGDAENTASTFKLAVLPTTVEGDPCFSRDADNRQGPGEETAPGTEVAVVLDDPSTGSAGYTLEASIPMALLPAAVDPAEMGLDVLVYDSDTQDRTGQTRLGWSTWPGVQGDPYRWGRATLEGYVAPADRPVEPVAPELPRTGLRSVDSPPSIAQAVQDDVALAGGEAATAREAAWLTGARVRRDAVVASVRARGPGELRLWVWDDEAAEVVASRVVEISRSGPSRWWVDLPEGADVGASTRVLAAWTAAGGGTLASEAPLR